MKKILVAPLFLLIAFGVWFCLKKGTPVSPSAPPIEETNQALPKLSEASFAVRALGDSLLQMMGKDGTAFHAWCDKAGNNYGYSPLFSSGGVRLPNGKYYGFGILCGFNGVKPWIINFFITDP